MSLRVRTGINGQKAETIKFEVEDKLKKVHPSGGARVVDISLRKEHVRITVAHAQRMNLSRIVKLFPGCDVFLKDGDDSDGKIEIYVKKLQRRDIFVMVLGFVAALLILIRLYRVMLK